MNKRLERIKAEEQASRKAGKKRNKLPFYGIVLVVVIFYFGQYIGLFGGNAASKEDAGSGDGHNQVLFYKAPSEAAGKARDSWNLVLVNLSVPLSRDFRVDLEEISGERVDTRIANPLRQMITDANQSGVSLTVCSAYRSVSRQKTLYSNKVQYYKNKGYSLSESQFQAGRYVQPPGNSEHHTGLAIDFLTGSLTTLNDGFADTTAYKWLSEHAAEYGFVERYPESKEQVTGIAWEPWHYRFVGIDNAKVMNDGDMCLEEYLEQLSK